MTLTLARLDWHDYNGRSFSILKKQKNSGSKIVTKQQNLVEQRKEDEEYIKKKMVEIS